jgi:hypothetical protein
MTAEWGWGVGENSPKNKCAVQKWSRLGKLAQTKILQFLIKIRLLLNIHSLFHVSFSAEHKI